MYRIALVISTVLFVLFFFFQFMHRLEFLNLSFFTLAHMKCQSFVSDGYTKTLKLEGE